MSKNCHRNLLIALGLIATMTWSIPASAQSGTRASVGSTKTISQGGSATKAETPLALNGYCPVCVLEMKKWVKGDPQFSVVQDGQVYLFPGEEQKQMFLKNSNRYTNVDLAAGGKCTACRVEMKQEVPGKSDFAAFHKGMRYWFPSEDQMKMFAANPEKYEVK